MQDQARQQPHDEGQSPRAGSRREGRLTAPSTVSEPGGLHRGVRMLGCKTPQSLSVVFGSLIVARPKSHRKMVLTSHKMDPILGVRFWVRIEGSIGRSS